MYELKFDIPIALFIFKRKDTTLRIIERIANVRPQKLYLIADYGRDEKEIELVTESRKAVEESINWDCEVVKYYAEQNRGVYANIGEGAKWVLSREEWAIFLEDDNLPEVTFFYYCKELLEKYKDSHKILWICGTNYLGKYDSADHVSYMFTQHLLPCGWASWSDKFLKYYDGEMKTFANLDTKEILQKNYTDRNLFRYQYRLFEKTRYKLKNDRKMCSWDYQMAYSVRMNNMYGISPIYNQIKNIGVDEFSEHNGTSFRYVMTRRFCGMASYPLEMPLKHPMEIKCDAKYEKLTGKIILPPFRVRMQTKCGDIIKKLLGIDRDASLLLYLKRKNRK